MDSVVSLGDGPIERQACLRLRDRDIHVKSVKFKEVWYGFDHGGKVLHLVPVRT